MKLKVGVIFGGSSVEHEISVISALQAIDNMDLNKYEVIPIYISKNRLWYTGDILKNIDPNSRVYTVGDLQRLRRMR